MQRDASPTPPPPLYRAVRRREGSAVFAKAKGSENDLRSFMPTQPECNLRGRTKRTRLQRLGALGLTSPALSCDSRQYHYTTAPTVCQGEKGKFSEQTFAAPPPLQRGPPLRAGWVVIGAKRSRPPRERRPPGGSSARYGADSSDLNSEAWNVAASSEVAPAPVQKLRSRFFRSRSASVRQQQGNASANR